MSANIDLQSSLGWYLQQRQQVMTVWQLFAAACVGVMGFATISEAAATCRLGILFAGGFAVLAAGNFFALHGMYHELHAAYALAREAARASGAKLPFTPPIGRTWALAFQALLSLGTFLAILSKVPWLKC